MNSEPAKTVSPNFGTPTGAAKVLTSLIECNPIPYTGFPDSSADPEFAFTETSTTRLPEVSCGLTHAQVQHLLTLADEPVTVRPAAIPSLTEDPRHQALAGMVMGLLVAGFLVFTGA